MRPTELVEQRLYHLRGALSNVYLGRDGKRLTLIDSGPPGSTGDIVAAIEALGLPPEAVDRIILTHAHVDHTGSAAQPARHCSAEVVAADTDADAIETGTPIARPSCSIGSAPSSRRCHR